MALVRFSNTVDLLPFARLLRGVNPAEVICFSKTEADALTFRYPIAVSASFGLLHGFGFAAALRGIGLPQNEIPTALLCFNVGVEIGQVAFVGTLFLLMYATRRVLAMDVDRPVHALAPCIRVPAVYLIGSVASYWLIARIDAFLEM